MAQTMLCYPLSMGFPHFVTDRFTVGVYPDLTLFEFLWVKPAVNLFSTLSEFRLESTLHS